MIKPTIFFLSCPMMDVTDLSDFCARDAVFFPHTHTEKDSVALTELCKKTCLTFAYLVGSDGPGRNSMYARPSFRGVWFFCSVFGFTLWVLLCQKMTYKST